jgi:hypothetical protein
LRSAHIVQNRGSPGAEHRPDDPTIAALAAEDRRFYDHGRPAMRVAHPRTQ